MPRKQKLATKKPHTKKAAPEVLNNGVLDESDPQQFLLRDAPMGYNPAYNQPAFTAFADVSPVTDVTTLNLNWYERDLPERARTKHVHRLHPYLGKFIPQLVEIFLRKHSPRKVYDPFCGSGTTLVEASVLGVDSVGCDISPFNCLLTRVKTEKYDTAVVEKEIRDILRRFNETVRKRRQPSLFGDHELVSTDNEYLNRWFHAEALSELLSFRSFIPLYKYQDLLKVIMTRAARSSRLTTHFDLDFPKRPQTEPYHCYKHGRICTPTDSAAKFLNRYCFDTLDRVKEYMRLRSGASVRVIEGDSREAKLPGFDMVMTSPPYVGLIDYHEQHRYAYELLGLSREAEPKEIGAAKKGSSEQARTNYILEIGEVFAHALSFMPSGGVMVVVVGDRQGMYDGLVKKLDVKVEHILRRHVNRRTGRRSTDFYESVLVWRKR
jgi:hypothetical protein